MTFLQFAVLSLAAFRISRLIIEDTIAKPLRDWILGRWPGKDVVYEEGDRVTGGTFNLAGRHYAISPTRTGDKVAKLLSCYWCTGAHISWMLVLAFYFWPTQTFWVAVPFAISAVVGMVGVFMAEVTSDDE